MNENEFEYNDIKLKAEEINIGIECCKRCYFRYKTLQECISLVKRDKIPNCVRDFRKDGREVIFVEVENEE